MPKTSGGLVTLTVDGYAYTFTKRALEGLPEAHGFLANLLARGKVSAANAVYYVKLVARLRRLGRLNTPEALVHRVEKTAANAFWRWCGESYAARVRPVLDALNNGDVRIGYRWLRRGSLVPSYPGKVIQWRMLPIPVKPGESPMPARTIAEEPCSTWTLHVPKKATTPVHSDPCPDCTCVKLTAEQVEVIAQAFESAWGHRNLDTVPAECFLFGTPPIDSKLDNPNMSTARTVAIAPDGALTMALEQLGASVSRDDLAFIDRARAADTAAVVVDFRVVKPDRIDAVLAVVREAAFRWHDAHPADAPAVVPAPLPTNNASLPGKPETVYGTVPARFEVEAPALPVRPLAPASSLADFAAMVLGPSTPLDTPPVAPEAPPGTEFTDWAAINAATQTKLVHCSVHREAHSVKTGDVECGPGAWVEIPQ